MTRIKSISCGDYTATAESNATQVWCQLRDTCGEHLELFWQCSPYGRSSWLSLVAMVCESEFNDLLTVGYYSPEEHLRLVEAELSVAIGKQTVVQAQTELQARQQRLADLIQELA